MDIEDVIELAERTDYFPLYLMELTKDLERAEDYEQLPRVTFDEMIEDYGLDVEVKALRQQMESGSPKTRDEEDPRGEDPPSYIGLTSKQIGILSLFWEGKKGARPSEFYPE